MRNPFKSAGGSPPDAVSADIAGASEKTSPSPPDLETARADLERIQKAHQWDPNLPQSKIDAVNKAIETGDPEEIIHAEELFTEDSPYEEVRAAVRNTDGGEVANTVRAWILGMFFVTIGSALNMFLSMRSAERTAAATSCPPGSHRV